jgi:hypothetical protein
MGLERTRTLGIDKVAMHFNFNFSAGEILWTLTFAALLVLLVVLLGRDRVKRFKWFTASMALMALRMLASRLLLGRMAPIVSSEIFLVLADLSAIIAVLVVVEMARQAFHGASRKAWIAATLILLAVAGVVVAEWGPWPSFKTLLAGSTLSVLRTMQLVAQKTDLLADTLIIQLGLLVVLFGRRFKAGWRSHVQQIVIGLSTASIAQLAVRLIWEEIALHTIVHQQADYQHVMDLQGKIYNANSVVYLAVLVWWIVCLWIDEPGASPAIAAPAEGASPKEGKSSPTEASQADD